MAAELLSQTLSQTIVNGFVQYQLVQTYQVLVPTRTTGPVAVINEVGLPLIGQSTIVDGITVWCRSKSDSQPDPTSAATRWVVVCNFSNNTSSFGRDSNGDPVSTPDEEVKQVAITWQEEQEPVEDAKFVAVWNALPWATLPGSVVTAPPWIPTTEGPVMNSAATPFELQRPKFTKQISVSRNEASWNNLWDTYINKVNSDEITITQEDSTGTKLSQTYPIGTLLMRPPTKTDIWADAIMYFRVTFNMLYRENTWTHYQVDAGTAEYLSTDQYKPDGLSTYTAQELEDEFNITADFGRVEVTTKGTEGATTLSGPQNFNGYGRVSPNKQPASADPKDLFYLSYKYFEEIAFAPLNL